MVLLKDQLDSTVKNVDMAKSFGMPVLAVIPRIEDSRKLALQARTDRRLYIAAGCYVMMILGVLAAEALGITDISRVLSKLSGLMS